MQKQETIPKYEFQQKLLSFFGALFLNGRRFIHQAGFTKYVNPAYLVGGCSGKAIFLYTSIRQLSLSADVDIHCVCQDTSLWLPLDRNTKYFEGIPQSSAFQISVEKRRSSNNNRGIHQITYFVFVFLLVIPIARNTFLLLQKIKHWSFPGHLSSFGACNACCTFVNGLANELHEPSPTIIVSMAVRFATE